MKNKSCLILLLTLFSVHVFSGLGLGWGFFAHKWINRIAVEGLPKEMRPFFERHQSYLSEHSIDPDLWRDKDPDEQYRHYIDIDMYGSYPFEELPRSFEQANLKFGEETVKKRGIATWWIVTSYHKLVEAMQSGDADTISAQAAALGHYVADLHMPLHTVENYDGQLTGNKGIHSRFEWRMIERFSKDIELTVEKAKYIEDPGAHIFEVVLNSFLLSDDVLDADTHAKQNGKPYDKEEDYDTLYYGELFNQAGALAEKQMSLAASTIGSYWYSAWVLAGKPELPLN